MQQQRVAEGARRGSQDRGCRRKAVQEMIGVDQPDYGYLLDEMDVSSTTAHLHADAACSRAVEVEVAFVLADDLPGAEDTRGRRAGASATSRCRPWRSSTPGSRTGRSGSPTPSPTTPRRRALRRRRGCRRSDIDIRVDADALTINGEVVAEGRSDAVPRQPGDRGGAGWPQGGVASASRCEPATWCCRGPAPVRAVRPGDALSPTSAGSAQSAEFRVSRGATCPEGDRRHRRVRQHRHRPACTSCARR